MNQQPLQVPGAENQGDNENITHYTNAVVECYERCRNSVCGVFLSYPNIYFETHMRGSRCMTINR